MISSKFLYAVAGCLLLAFIASGSRIKKSLVAHYAFDGVLKDKRSYKNDGMDSKVNPQRTGFELAVLHLKFGRIINLPS